MVLLWLAVSVVLSKCIAFEQSELVFVHTIWNHGSSSPLKPIPSDTKNLAATWREGLGETTQRGRAEAFKLGRALRERYLVDNNLLAGGAVLSQELYIRSSDHNRSISSAYATLAGFLSETKNTSHWTTVPVHSRPLEFDELLNSDSKCPFADKKLEQRITESNIFKDIHNIEFLQLLVREGGYASLLREPKTLYYLWEALKSIDDMTLQGLLASLGALQGKLPSESAAITVELWRNSKNKHEIRVLYRSDSTGKFRHILISGCRDLACPFKAFSKRSKSFIPDDWEEECGMISYEFGNLDNQCNEEVDESSEKNCKDWAEYNYCREDAAVRYLFCRKTCLCNPKFSKHKLKRT